LNVAVAADATDLLRNTEIDYVTEGVNGVIKYNNPNVVDECGCGESFNVG
ncbi:iron-sulfur cluster assembly accessory protein, partial [Pseudomonas sp. HMWF031]